jgi:nicotinamide mononucleotide transporter
MIVGFFKGLTKFEKIWFGVFAAAILGSTIALNLSTPGKGGIGMALLNWVVAPLSALTGIITVVLCAKGNIYNFAFGIVNAAAYGWVAWVSGYYGDWLLNWFYFLPTQVLIYFSWRHRLRPDKPDIVRMRRLRGREIFAVSLIGFAALVGFGLFLLKVDHWFTEYMKRSAGIYSNITALYGWALLGPLCDSATEVFQIIAQILCIRRQAEQWIFWIATNVLTVLMWVAVVVTDKSSLSWAVPTLVMWAAFLVNSFWGLRIWMRNSKGASRL